MSLTRYKEKRSFHKTPEPTGGKPDSTKLAFVVQKHQASHLHYDFRLEVKGVLISWAVPKGPQKDPALKRLAMLVEDHPYDYKDFEGIIPEGNYGAGTVIVWDQGYYTPFNHKTGKVDQQTKAEMEKQLTKDFRAGQVKIMLHGKKLKGKYALIRTKRGDDDSGRNWLLIKDRDEHASAKEHPFNDKSVVSGKTLEQLAKSKHPKEWKSNHSSNTDPAARVAKKITAAADSAAIKTPRPLPSAMVKATAKAFKQKGKTKKLYFTFHEKRYTAEITESLFGGQRTLVVETETGKGKTAIFHYTWLSDSEIHWTDFPDKEKQAMAKAIAKELVS